MNTENDIPPYKMIEEGGGHRYRFYCACSGIAVYMSPPIRASDAKEELVLSWNREARKYFNRCSKCGKWVCDMMYNVDAMECVDCSPWTEQANFCPLCGAPLPPIGGPCPGCTQFPPGEVEG